MGLVNGPGRLSAAYPTQMTESLPSAPRYLRVAGGLKRSHDGHVMHIRHLAPIQNPHELYHHILQAISEDVTVTRGKSYSQVCKSRQRFTMLTFNS